MVPGIYALRVYAGDDFSQEFSFSLPPVFPATVGDPMNLTGLVFRAQWRPSRASTESVDFAIDSSQLAAGKVTISFTAAQTAALRTGVFDLQATRTATGKVLTYVQGDVEWTKDVTRV